MIPRSRVERRFRSQTRHMTTDLRELMIRWRRRSVRSIRSAPISRPRTHRWNRLWQCCTERRRRFARPRLSALISSPRTYRAIRLWQCCTDWRSAWGKLFPPISRPRTHRSIRLWQRRSGRRRWCPSRTIGMSIVYASIGRLSWWRLRTRNTSLRRLILLCKLTIPQPLPFVRLRMLISTRIAGVASLQHPILADTVILPWHVHHFRYRYHFLQVLLCWLMK